MASGSESGSGIDTFERHSETSTATAVIASTVGVSFTIFFAFLVLLVILAIRRWRVKKNKQETEEFDMKENDAYAPAVINPIFANRPESDAHIYDVV